MLVAILTCVLHMPLLGFGIGVLSKGCINIVDFDVSRLWLKNHVHRPKTGSIPLNIINPLLSCLVGSLVASKGNQLPCLSLFDEAHAILFVKEVLKASCFRIPEESLFVTTSTTVLNPDISLIRKEHCVVSRYLQRHSMVGETSEEEYFPWLKSIVSIRFSRFS